MSENKRYPVSIGELVAALRLICNHTDNKYKQLILKEAIHRLELSRDIRGETVTVKPRKAYPVIRCKNCKHFKRTPENDTYCDCVGGMADPEENDFCSYGERRKK